MFLRATLVAGSSSSSVIIFLDFNFSCASFSIGFRLSVFSSSFSSCVGRRYSGDAPIFIWEVFIALVLRSSERIAEAKTGSIWIARATWTGREGPCASRNSKILFFFSWMSIIWLES